MSNRPHVWITGASRGIGLAAAQELSATCNLSLSGRNEAALREVEHLLTADSSVVVPVDVADQRSVLHAHAAATARFGPVDILINNAGIGIFKPFVELQPEEFHDQIDINLRGAFYCTQAVLPSMIHRRRGMIITINSVSVLRAFTASSAYAASKAGVHAMMASIREEVRSSNVKVIELFVGATDTNIWPDAARDEHGHRMMTAFDIADVITDVVRHLDHPRMLQEEIIIRPQLGDL